MNSYKWDIAIVGGGLAGASAALEVCSKSNLSIVLIEKDKIGANKVTPSVYMKAIKEFGLDECVLQEYKSFVHHGPLTSSAQFSYGYTIYAAIDYEKACRTLIDRIKPGKLTVIQTEAISCQPVTNINQPLLITLKDGTVLETKLVIDASGFSQWGAHQFHIPLSKLFSQCYGELLSGCVNSDFNSFRFLGPKQAFGNGGGWYYPIGANCASMGFSVVIPEYEIVNKRLMDGYFSAKKLFKPYNDWVSNSERKRIEIGIIPISRIGRFTKNRVLIVGDAAGQAHPWVVEGCRPALYNGRLCAKTALMAFAKGRFDREYLNSYEKAWKKINGERFWRAASVAEIVWTRSDEIVDQNIRKSAFLDPELMLDWMRDNYTTIFHKVYARVGYTRRQCVKWIKKNIG
jgi:flavin-dependent dehydrogenase